MARPKQAEYRKRKRQAEEALARAQPVTDPSSSIFAQSRADLPAGREMNGDGARHVVGEVVFDVAQGSIEEFFDVEGDGAEFEGDGDENDFGEQGEGSVDGIEDTEEGEEEDEEEEKGPPKKKSKKNGGGGAQVLPVADLPDDWEGDVEDGATYLALAMRADKALPTYTRAVNPWSDTAPAIEVQTTAAAAISVDAQPPSTASASSATGTQSQAGPSRHPALPKESWQTTFPLHFVAYKKTIAESWPPSPPLPYPPTWPRIPPTSQKGEWGYFINGYPRKKVSPPSAPKVMDKGKGKQKAAAAEVDEEEMANGASEEMGEEDMELDEDEEEAAMNVEKVEDVLEPLTERHKPRDPHVCVLQRLDTHQIISVLSTLTSHIQNTLTPLETDLIPPSYDPLVASSRRPHTRKNPYSEHYSRWIFALLLVLDPFLSAGQVSVLRELARVIIRVGGWRWVEAVMAGEVGLPASSGGAGDGTGAEGEADGGEGSHWMLGARWKYARDTREANGTASAEMALPPKDQIPPGKRAEYDETGVDETLARCWLVVHAIAAGWGQKDLVMDLEEMFS